MSALPTTTAAGDSGHAALHNNANAVTNQTRRPLLKLAAQNLKGESFPLELVTSSAAAAGTVYTSSVGLGQGDVVTALHFYTLSAPAGLTLARAALLDSANKVLALSGDVKASVTALGEVVAPLTAPYTVLADGLFRLAFLQVGTTAAALARTGVTSGSFVPTLGGVPRSTSKAAVADFPIVGSTMASMVATSFTTYGGWH